jgi:pseudaminic acid synthase
MIWIAEIGVNHLGSYEKALRMVKRAKDCGATHIKFQKYNPVKVLGKNHPALKDAHQFSWKELTELSAYTHSLRLLFGCSVFDVNDIAIVDGISDYHKIASRMNQDAEFVSRIEKCKRLTFMSVQPETTSMRIPDRFKLMWCIREYPTLKEDILKYPYNRHFGLSSHCPDINATLAAIKQGAQVIEHHVCESREEQGCDINSSITFEEFKTLINESSNHIAKQ